MQKSEKQALRRGTGWLINLLINCLLWEKLLDNARAWADTALRSHLQQQLRGDFTGGAAESDS